MMGWKSDETFEIEGEIEARTPKAVLFHPTIGEKCWIPKSQIVNEYPVGDDKFVLVITEWIAKKNGLC